MIVVVANNNNLEMVRSRDLDSILEFEVLVKVTLVNHDRRIACKGPILKLVGARKRHLPIVIGPIVGKIVRSLCRRRQLTFLLNDFTITEIEDGPPSGTGHIVIGRDGVSQIVGERRKHRLLVP